MLEKHLAHYGDPGFSRFFRRAMTRNLGFHGDDWQRPVVGILNTFSEVNRCHAHFGPIVAAIKNGVLMAGGIPLEFPTISLGEPFLEPSSMLFRNLASMDAEEMIAAQPLDAVVLVGACDKTLPALVMGAASADVPALVVSGGPMLAGEYRGRRLGACTDCRRTWTEFRAGTIGEAELDEINAALAPTNGHCMVMGTASTMALTIEALGLMLPGGAILPAVDQRRLAHAEASGKAAVDLARRDVRPSSILTPKAYRNALRVLAAIGGSTNAVIHLTAMAGRSGIRIALDDFATYGAEIPLLVNVKPIGAYHAEDLAYAGGLPTVMRRLGPLLELDAPTVTGATHAQNLARASAIGDDPAYRDIVRPLDDPLFPDGGLAVVRGNLAPDGAIVKTHAATPALLRHRGPAYVFENEAALHRSLADGALELTPEHVLVLASIGPIGGPGMPESGMIPIPSSLLRAGVRDIVRISDGRMSGTAYGTIVLHVAPESAIGGPLGRVRTGDTIALDVAAGRIDVEISPREWEARGAQVAPSAPQRGYKRLYAEHVMQAPDGVDFDFLRPPLTQMLADASLRSSSPTHDNSAATA